MKANISINSSRSIDLPQKGVGRPYYLADACVFIMQHIKYIVYNMKKIVVKSSAYTRGVQEVININFPTKMQIQKLVSIEKIF